MTDQASTGAVGGAPGASPAGNTSGNTSFVAQRSAQMAASMQPAPGEQPAPDARQQQQQRPQQQNNGRPSYVLDSEWDAGAGRVNDKFGERVNRLTAFEAEQAVRKNTLPKSETDYAIKLPGNFQMPAGTAFEFDQNSPALAQARKIALARGLDQDTFSDLLGVYAAHQISEQMNAARAREANLQQLGPAGPQRTESVAVWLQARAGDDGKKVADFIRQYPSAPIVKAMESLIKQFSSQGGADFSQSHREHEDTSGKMPNWDTASFAEKRVWQMSQMLNRPGYRGGGGRRGE